MSQGFRQPSTEITSRFSTAPSAEINRSTFDRSHAHKTTFDAGRLVPVFLDEVLPGDTFDMQATIFTRLATPLRPVMDNIHMDLHFWFIPNRLTWLNWERFMGEQNNPSDDITLLSVPMATIDTSVTPFTDNSLAPYFGITQKPFTATRISALPFRAYYVVWNEWYRDQNLQSPYPFEIDDDGDITGIDQLAKRNKRHDYFTSSLPFRQKGDPVSIPLVGDAPVLGIGFDSQADYSTGGLANVRQTTGPLVDYAEGWRGQVASTPAFGVLGVDSLPGTNTPNIRADLSQASTITVSDLRTAFQIQKLLERDARGGTRYIELVLSHFNVRSDDARLQRPEYLGGGHGYVNINPVVNTVGSDNTGQLLPQGELAAYGVGVLKGGFTKSFTEHGYCMGLLSARADLTYQQGINRMWFRETRYDFYWPSLAHLSEQAVLNREIWCDGSAQDTDVWGYQEIWAEYRYKPSIITGKFSSENAASLDVWHLSQDFENRPALNDTFIQEEPPIDRVIAVPDEPHFISDIWFDFKCTRPLPVYSVPGLIDHF